jgi:hypothetical protein
MSAKSRLADGRSTYIVSSRWRRRWPWRPRWRRLRPWRIGDHAALRKMPSLHLSEGSRRKQLVPRERDGRDGAGRGQVSGRGEHPTSPPAVVPTPIGVKLSGTGTQSAPAAIAFRPAVVIFTRREQIGGTLRCNAMPAYSPPYRQTPEGARLPVPAAPTLTRDGFCSVCGATPVSLCEDEVQVCRGCLAVLWNLDRRPAATPKQPKPRAPSAEEPTSSLRPALRPEPEARRASISENSEVAPLPSPDGGLERQPELP